MEPNKDQPTENDDVDLFTKKKGTLDETASGDITISIDGKPEKLQKSDIEGKNWDDLKVPNDIITQLSLRSFKAPARSQAFTIKYSRENPESILVLQSPNGSGKTLSFIIPLLERIEQEKSEAPGITFENKNGQSYINYSPQAVILAHTRELATQIESVLHNLLTLENKQSLRGIKVCLVKAKAYNDIQNGGHILITTPGVLKNVFDKKPTIDLDKKFGVPQAKVMVGLEKVKVFVTDEFDDVFVQDENKRNLSSILQKTSNSSLLLFISATLNEQIRNFINGELKKIKPNKKQIIYEVPPEDLTVANIKQSYIYVKQEDINNIIITVLNNVASLTAVIIFFNTIRSAENLYKALREQSIKAMIIHSKLKVEERDMAMKYLLQGKIKVLISTNLLARGFDDKNISLVINAELPENKDDNSIDYNTYLHRIGRTGRWENKGVSFSIVGNEKQKQFIPKIEDHFKTNITPVKTIEELVRYIEVAKEESGKSNSQQIYISLYHSQ